MLGGMRCKVRLVVFAGFKTSKQKAAKYVSLDHCASFIAGKVSRGLLAVGTYLVLVDATRKLVWASGSGRPVSFAYGRAK